VYFLLSAICVLAGQPTGKLEGQQTNKDTITTNQDKNYEWKTTAEQSVQCMKSYS
jgi:hypothetical protein